MLLVLRLHHKPRLMVCGLTVYIKINWGVVICTYIFTTLTRLLNTSLGGFKFELIYQVYLHVLLVLLFQIY